MIKSFWEKWQRVARKIGDFQARVILTVLYFVIIGPFALIVRWAADPLSLKKGTLPGWRVKADKADTEESAMKRAMNQF